MARERERDRDGGRPRRNSSGSIAAPRSVCGYLLDVGYPSAASLFLDARRHRRHIDIERGM